MASVSVTINQQQLNIALENVHQALEPVPLLKIAGQVMRSSIVQTFSDQGSPAGSWTPLAKSTLKRGKGGAGRKILIQSGRLRNSVTDDSKYVIQGNTLTIGSNLVYAAIQQEGGYAGRSTPSNHTLKREVKKEARGFNGPRNQFGYFSFKRAFIPARPYLVIRPEDPAKIEAAIQRYIAVKTGGTGAN